MPLRVALIQSPAWGTTCPPYGLAVLKSYLRSRGHAAKAWDLNIEFHAAAGAASKLNWDASRHPVWLDREKVKAALSGELLPVAERSVEAVAAFEPDVVGFSCVFSNQHAAQILAGMVKRRLPKAVVVFGGPQASLDADGEGIAVDPNVDYVVQGEGEETFCELLERLERGAPMDDCRGLLYGRGGRLTKTPSRPLIADLTGLPHADFTDFPLDYYTDEGCIPVSLSRGCPNQCKFCYEVEYWDRFRVRKAHSLVAEVIGQYRTLPYVHSLLFHDSLVNGHMEELKRFAQGLIDAGVKTRWSSQAVIRKEMTREVLQLLKDSGCVCLNFGLESASFATMLRMGKVLAKGADLDRIVRDAHEVGIECVLNFMFGFPGETEADFQESLDFVRRNKDYISMVQPSPGFCDFYKGTYGHRNPDELGIVLAEGSALWSSKDGANTYLTRLDRFERFLELVYSLGVRCAHPPRLFMRDSVVADYLYARGERAAAAPHYLKAVRRDPFSVETLKRLIRCLEASGRGHGLAARWYRLRLWLEEATAPSGFRFALLLNPGYLRERWRQIKTPADFLRRAAGLPRYAFSLAWHAFFWVRGRLMLALKELRGEA